MSVYTKKIEDQQALCGQCPGDIKEDINLFKPVTAYFNLTQSN